MPHLVTGTVYGPGGTSICNDMPPGGQVAVRAMFESGGPSAVTVATCPTNTYTLNLNPGRYYLRVQPLSASLSPLPWRFLDQTPLLHGGGDATRDIPVETGLPLGGGVLLDGNPVGGVGFTLVYQQPNLQPAGQLQAALLTSSASGGWFDNFGRHPAPIQGGIGYRFSIDCTLLGTRALGVSPASPFVFPTDATDVTCQIETADAEPFTHDRNALAVTSYAGDIGGQSPAFWTVRGRGFGVQFPIGPSGPAVAPVATSHLFRGGLMVGVAPDVVLTGVSLAGYEYQCGGSCQDLVADASGHTAAPDPHGKFIRWRMTDAGSPEGVGLQVTQESFDGDGTNYVLYHYRFQNGGEQTTTFWAGVWADWDVDGTPLDDIGQTALDGRLMYQASTSGAGTYAGTVLLGAPVTGDRFFTAGTGVVSPAAQVDALRGASVLLSVPAGGDHRYIHGAGPFTLRKGHSANLWLAVVAGHSLADLTQAAAAAATDVDQRGRGPVN
ncbi:MAG: hypothetical protein HY700_20370 [Gemmatimonadetes bacterium]|nr:hypothetical protein [Gemmatimonadota bacterium]